MRLDLDLGDDDEVDALDAHLAERGLGVEDILTVAEVAVARRKGGRLYAYGRGLGGRPVVVVMIRRGPAWRPRTAWSMDGVELRWWRRHGGR
jgi:hypothetical protein